MTPAEHLAMTVGSPLLDDLNAWDRLDLVRSEADPWTSLSTGERHLLTAAHALETIDAAASYLDDFYTQRIADALVAQSYRLRGVS
jgi:hypothetical protein